MWYALQARPGAEVLAGLKPHVTREQFRRAIADGTAEDCLEHVPLSEGEAIFIPARTAHTIGPGLVLCEIQQHSDLTYRVFDYNRRDAQGRTRELHIEKALEVMRFGPQTCEKLAPLRLMREGVRETHFVACCYFATEKWELEADLQLVTSPERFELLILLDGSGEIRWKESSTRFDRAQAWLIPAALGPYRLKPDGSVSLLRTYLPGDLNNFGNAFAGRNVKQEDWKKLLRP
jgi:mannose-6-phosphate isomerase